MRAILALLSIALASASVSGLLARQDSAHRSKNNDDGQVYAELAKAPQKARDRQNPLAKDADAIPAGRNLFEQHCAECHGDSAQGGRKGPSLRAEQVQNAEPGAIFWLLTNGVVRRGMPVWSKLPEPQRWQLVTYLKSLGVARPATLPAAASDPPPTAPAPRR